MNIGILYYEGFANHEIIIACHEFRKQNIIAIGIDNNICTSTEKQKIKVDVLLEEADPSVLDVLIIPGGITSQLYDNKKLMNLIRTIAKNNKIVGGICGGTFLMAKAGILDDKKCTGHFISFKEDEFEYKFFSKAEISDSDVVADGNIVTARGKAYIEFGLILAKTAGLLSDNKDYNEEYTWLKNLV